MNSKMLFAAFFFYIISLSFFFIGFHSVDLAVHYYDSSSAAYFKEVTLWGGLWTIDQVYTEGIFLMIIGFFLFGCANLALGSVKNG